MILTDGQSSTGYVNGLARRLKNSGVVIFCVGIGQSVCMHDLRVMASQPADQHVITPGNFSKVERLAKLMSSRTCNGESSGC